VGDGRQRMVTATIGQTVLGYGRGARPCGHEGMPAEGRGAHSGGGPRTLGERRVRTTVGTLVIKYVVIAALAALILPAVGRVTWTQALVPAAVVAVLTYLLGDRLALRALGNAGAVVVDFALALVLFWLAPVYVPGVRLGFGGALTAAGAVAVAEILYHQYLLERGVGVR